MRLLWQGSAVSGHHFAGGGGARRLSWRPGLHSAHAERRQQPTECGRGAGGMPLPPCPNTARAPPIVCWQLAPHPAHGACRAVAAADSVRMRRRRHTSLATTSARSCPWRRTLLQPNHSYRASAWRPARMLLKLSSEALWSTLKSSAYYRIGRWSRNPSMHGLCTASHARLHPLPSGQPNCVSPNSDVVAVFTQRHARSAGGAAGGASDAAGRGCGARPQQGHSGRCSGDTRGWAALSLPRCPMETAGRSARLACRHIQPCSSEKEMGSSSPVCLALPAH